MTADHRDIQRIGFILIPGFALMSYASATEPLRAANLLAARELYHLAAFSPDGRGAMSSAGVTVPAGPLPRRAEGLHTVFVCAGGDPGQWQYPAVLDCLRLLARQGVRIGGISGGPFLLASAGLLEGRRFTIHWEHAPALMEGFPNLSPERARYVVDANRITCGGGIAPLDMMHALIGQRLGADFAHRVSDWYLHTHVDTPGAPQRGSLAERYGAHHPALLAAIEKMEASIETPLTRSAIASVARVSPRHLDRLFASHLHTTFLAAYRQIRLDHARRLLRQSALSVSEIAFATGFSSAGQLSRSYRTRFGRSPRTERA